MNYEVELKFPVTDAAPLLVALGELGAEAQPEVVQADAYFRHPARDFATTGEALRVRTMGRESCVTYKGPVVDSQVKVRRELEVFFAESGDGERMAEILRRLGFTDVATVRKRRTPYRLSWEGRAIEIVLDDVEQLGRFVEIEAIADEADRDAARDSVLRLAKRLGLENPQRKSYLRQLLEQSGST